MASAGTLIKIGYLLLRCKAIQFNQQLLLDWVAISLVIELLALYFAQQDGSGIFEIMLQVGTLLLMPITIPLLFGMFIRKTPWWAALASIACGLIASSIAYIEVALIYFWFSQAYSDTFEWHFQQQFFAVFGASTFGFLLFDFEKEIGEGNDQSQLSAIGVFGHG